MPLSKVTLDSVTMTEVLRLHLLSSGGSPGAVSAEWRYVPEMLCLKNVVAGVVM